ncbi:ABC transporter permease [Micromonospora sp. NPDC005252]|uniref:ABC transporter permease n=1 Tax=Micromonospora sp. NPDC005252 TaxID=3364228 RepID=UPI0036842B64
MTGLASITRSAPDHAVTGLATRQVRRGALLVVLFAATMPAIVVAGYDSVMADPSASASLDALAGNPAIRTLFGDPIALDEAGGFTVWRVGTFVAVVLAVWSILSTTRITRGEEDAGRWDVLLAGRATLRGVVVRHVAVVAFVPVLAGLAVTAVLSNAGPDRTGAVVHGVGLSVLGLFAVAVAALTAQIFPARAVATGVAIAVLGVGLLARMVGDGLSALAWLRWLSPFGLLELSAPYGPNRPLPLMILLVMAALVSGAALAAAARRDVGGGLVAPATGRPPRLRTLSTVEAFAVRRVLIPLIAWSTGVIAYFLLIGLTTTSVTDFLADKAAIVDAAAQAGFTGLDTVAGLTATIFALLALPVGAFTAVRMGAFVAAESDRRLTLLAAQPLSRLRLLSAELVTTIGGALVLLSVAAIATWVGVVAVGGDFAITAALQGTWNTLPIVLLSAGAAVLATGMTPSAVTAVGCLPATGGFLLQVTADSVGAPAWVASLSPFAHLAPVPLVSVDWPGAFVMTGLAGALMAAGAVAYRRRDLRG